MTGPHRAPSEIRTEPLWLFAPDRPWAPVLGGLTMLVIAALAATALILALDGMGTVPAPAPSTGKAATAVHQPGPEE